MLKGGFISICVCVLIARYVTGSAWLQDPPSRSAAWNYQIKAPVNYNFRNINCGGVPVRIEIDGSRNCGLCGDAYTDPIPRANEIGGKYADPVIRTRYYEEGQVADISIWNNLPGSPGFYEFRLCETQTVETQACFDKHLLTIIDHDGGANSTRMPVPQAIGLVIVHLQLPVPLQCDFCVLQWRFRKENSAEGCDDNNWCGVGRGPQIEYYNCADVMIGAVGQPKPDFIQDPTYSDADYGSAYDIATTRNNVTTPDGGNLGGDTTTANNVVTIPTAFPTPAPTTAATTNRPGVITTQPSVTTTQPSQSGTTAPANNRLVFDGSGNQIGSIFGGGSSTGIDRSLLLLLGVLPLLGAVALRNNQQVPILPPLVPTYWAQNVPYMGMDYGFGSFGGIGGDSYSSGFGSESLGGYGSGGFGGNALWGNFNNFGGGAGIVNNGIGIGGLQPTNQILQSQSFTNAGVGGNNVGYSSFNNGGTFVTNPVVWTNGVNPVNNFNNGFNQVVQQRFKRAYQHAEIGYAVPASSLMPSPPSPSNVYQPPPTPTGYGKKPSFPTGPVPTFPQQRWPTNTFNNVNNFPPAGNGQIFPTPSPFPPSIPTMFPPPNTDFNLPGPGIETAAQFVASDPQRQFTGNQGWDTNHVFPVNNNNGGSGGFDSLQVHDWYTMLMAPTESRPL